MEEKVEVDSESSGGRIAVMIPRYSDSSRRLAVSRSSMMVWSKESRLEADQDRVRGYSDRGTEAYMMRV